MKYVYIGTLGMLAAAFGYSGHFWLALFALLGIIWIERKL